MQKSGYAASNSIKTRPAKASKRTRRRRKTVGKRPAASVRKRRTKGRSGRSASSGRSNAQNGRRLKKRLLAAAAVLIALAAAVLLVWRPIGKRLYPMRYTEYVTRFAREYGLDPCLVFAVIKVESDFTPDAVSRTGAQGLMQIMPDTADWVAWRLGREHDESRIFEPEYNIEMGCYLLGYLLDYYDGDLEFTLAAYNAGKNAVDGWLASAEYYDGSTLIIPYEETHNYVIKVNSVYESYKELYHEEYCV